MKIKVSADWETLVSVYENDTSIMVAERCLKPEFMGNPPWDLINELSVIIQMRINSYA